MKIVFLLLFFLLQPVLWLTVIRSGVLFLSRVKRERKLFRSAIYEDFFEGRHLLKSTLFCGVIASIMGILLISVSAKWIVVYIALELISVVVLSFTSLPITLITLSGVLVTLITVPNDLFGLSWLTSALSASLQAVPIANLIAILGIILVLNGLYVIGVGGNYPSPIIDRNKRNTRIAKFRFNESAVVPMLLLVPGNWFEAHLSFWPVFNYGGHSYTLFILPLLLGLRFTVKRGVLGTMIAKVAHVTIATGVLALLGAIITKFIPAIGIYALITIWLVYLISLMVIKSQDRRIDFEYSEVMDGVRVLGIKPETPAAKMNLEVGDIILEVNGELVTNETELYQAISQNSTYCKLKVRDRNDQLKITETAIFKNSPHEIGIKTYSDYA
ncbi:PDZ domain-containing protein [Lentilactobacillus kosonis]|uniref:Cell division topological determinant MinJ n=1 Tax=Lentilactobacillus kosonis TaxID=2810561 RepID=A0A401FK00_9LACO|nr:PDZ domain-containing protein [Lentilactobacillus kosonis]GAY72673.1 cell division topological determinant MinJ [Lentilactobacillus kosonis]